MDNQENTVLMYFYTELTGATCLFVQTKNMQHSIKANWIKDGAPIAVYSVEYNTLKAMMANIEHDLREKDGD